MLIGGVVRCIDRQSDMTEQRNIACVDDLERAIETVVQDLRVPRELRASLAVYQDQRDGASTQCGAAPAYADEVLWDVEGISGHRWLPADDSRSGASEAKAPNSRTLR
jgi:hypothetical protein